MDRKWLRLRWSDRAIHGKRLPLKPMKKLAFFGFGLIGLGFVRRKCSRCRSEPFARKCSNFGLSRIDCTTFERIRRLKRTRLQLASKSNSCFNHVQDAAGVFCVLFYLMPRNFSSTHTHTLTLTDSVPLPLPHRSSAEEPLNVVHTRVRSNVNFRRRSFRRCARATLTHRIRRQVQKCSSFSFSCACDFCAIFYRQTSRAQ